MLLIRRIDSVRCGEISLCRFPSQAMASSVGFHRLLHCVAPVTSGSIFVSVTSSTEFSSGSTIVVGRLYNVESSILTQGDENRGMIPWDQPLTVPGCFVSSLQTFKWSGYLGSPEEIEVAVYILENACLLNTATFISDDRFLPKLEILKELSFTSRASTTCQLVFY